MHQKKPPSVKVYSHNFSPLYFKELARLDKFSKNRFFGPHLCWRRSPSHSKLGPHFGAVSKRGTWGYRSRYCLKKVFLITPYALQLVMQCRLWCIVGCDALKVMMHCRWWCTEAIDALKLVMHWRRWCTEAGDALQVVMHFLLIHRFLLSLL